MQTGNTTEDYRLPVKVVLADVFFDKENSELFFGFFKSSLGKLYFPNIKLSDKTDCHASIFSLINDCVVLDSLDSVILNVEYVMDLPDRYVGHVERDILILYTAIFEYDSKINDSIELIKFKDFANMYQETPEKLYEDHGLCASIISQGNPATEIPEEYKEGYFANVGQNE